MGMRKRDPSALVAILHGIALTTAGCGAIFNGTRPTIAATSAPDGAKNTADAGRHPGRRHPVHRPPGRGD